MFETLMRLYVARTITIAMLDKAVTLGWITRTQETAIKALRPYSVTYDGNGATAGSVPVDSNTYVSGASATVLDNTDSLAKTGYIFHGWDTAADGSGTTVAVGATLTIGSANVTLYAQWTASTAST